MTEDERFGYLQLVADFQSGLYAYIRRLAPGLVIDDILQETNIVLWEKAASFQMGTNFKSFALRVAHLKTLEALRNEKRRNWLVFDSDLLEKLVEEESSEPPMLADEQAALRECLAQLNPYDRELLHQRYTMGRTIRAIARDYRSSEGALQQGLFRLRKLLRTCIERRLAILGVNS